MTVLSIKEAYRLPTHHILQGADSAAQQGEPDITGLYTIAADYRNLGGSGVHWRK